jgi:uncharacterized membrane protein YbhN (UPF0104 family)
MSSAQPEEGAPEPAPVSESAEGAPDPLALASVALSAMGFLTLLRLADRRDRTPAKALGLFLATTLESTVGAGLGIEAIRRSRSEGAVERPKSFVAAAAGVVIGVITSALMLNWMRTTRRV